MRRIWRAALLALLVGRGEAQMQTGPIVHGQIGPMVPGQVGPVFETQIGPTLDAPFDQLGIESGAVVGGSQLSLGRAAFLGQLYPPRQVMLHQKDLDLRPAQVEAIKKAVVEAQQQLVDIQWRLDGETATLAGLMAGDHVDEAAALGKLQEVAAIEQEMKNVNFTLLVRIKNQLDSEQQAKLRALGPRGFGVRVFGSGPVPAPPLP